MCNLRVQFLLYTLAAVSACHVHILSNLLVVPSKFDFHTTIFRQKEEKKNSVVKRKPDSEKPFNVLLYIIVDQLGLRLYKDLKHFFFSHI